MDSLLQTTAQTTAQAVTQTTAQAVTQTTAQTVTPDAAHIAEVGAAAATEGVLIAGAGAFAVTPLDLESLENTAPIFEWDCHMISAERAHAIAAVWLNIAEVLSDNMLAGEITDNFYNDENMDNATQTLQTDIQTATDDDASSYEALTLNGQISGIAKLYRGAEALEIKDFCAHPDLIVNRTINHIGREFIKLISVYARSIPYDKLRINASPYTDDYVAGELKFDFTGDTDAPQEVDAHGHNIYEYTLDISDIADSNQTDAQGGDSDFEEAVARSPSPDFHIHKQARLDE